MKRADKQRRRGGNQAKRFLNYKELNDFLLEVSKRKRGLLTAAQAGGLASTSGDLSRASVVFSVSAMDGFF